MALKVKAKSRPRVKSKAKRKSQRKHATTDFAACRNNVGVLLPYQKRWVEDKAEIKICEKSRRVGISWAEASDSSLYAASASGGDVWYIGYTKDMALEFINDCASWLSHYQQGAEAMEEVALEDEDKDITAYRIKLPSGFRITALSSRPANLRGKQGRVIIDEAAFHPDLDGMITAATALLMWGGDIRIISTHFGEDNPFSDLIKDTVAGKTGYSHHKIDFDLALGEGLYDRICGVRGIEWSPERQAAWRKKIVDFYRDKANEELFCQPAQGTGFYFPRIVVEQSMDSEIPVLRWECKTEFATRPKQERMDACNEWIKENLAPVMECLNKNHRHYAGEDFGRSGDLSIFAPLEELSDLKYRAPFLVELRNIPYQQQKQVWFYILDHLPRFSGAAMDTRGNGEFLGEVSMQKYGESRILQVKQTVSWYEEFPPKYKSALEDKTCIIAGHSDVLMDHRVVKMEKGRARVPDNLRTAGTDGGQRHGDAFVAYCLAWQARGNPAVEIEFQTSGNKRRSTGVARYLD